MITFCPFIAETKEGQVELYAILDEDGFCGFFDRLLNNVSGFNIKGFRTQEIKDFWERVIVPAFSFSSFDPQI